MRLASVCSERPPKIPWYRKLIYAAVPTLTLFAVLEIGLRLVGVAPLSESQDPFVGFSSQMPLFVAEGGPTRMRVTAPAKRVWFNQQAFPAEKPENTKRVFCVGGSTTFGRPYSDATSYSAWLRGLLPKVDEQKWEVINAGGVSYASYRVAKLMEELATYEPDLFVVYSVHNEFLERRTYDGMFERTDLAMHAEGQLRKLRTFTLVDRIMQRIKPQRVENQRVENQRVENQPDNSLEILPAEVDERLNHTIGPTDYHRDDEWRRRVLEHYRFNLKRMVSIARKAGADIVFITPASNERDCSPFKSESKPGISADELAAFNAAMAAWEKAKVAGDPNEARRQIELALDIDPEHAEALYRRGTTLVELGKNIEAHQAFVDAIDNDICPLRAVSEISTAVREVAQESDVPVIDFEELLHERCRNEFGSPNLGGEYFLDHVHPTMAIHRQLAIWIIEQLQREQIVGGRSLKSPEGEAAIAAVQQQIDSSLDAEDQGVALRNLAKVLHWSGKFAEAAPPAREALEILPHDLESRFVLADCLVNLGNQEEAILQYEQLFRDGDMGRAYLPYAELLLSYGDLERARAYALLAVLFKPENAYSYYLLGQVHLQNEEYELAVDAFQQADQLSPNDPATGQLLETAKRLSREKTAP